MQKHNAHHRPHPHGSWHMHNKQAGWLANDAIKALMLPADYRAAAA